jgi:hypothetical protein
VARTAKRSVPARIIQRTQETVMTHIRSIALAAALVAGSTLIACTTAPAAMPMGGAMNQGMANPENMAAMQAQMKTMGEMHGKMMNAKTADERQALMAEHMKAMQGGMAAMKGMPGMGGMAGTGAMGDAKGMPADMAQRHGMMAQHMEMMQMMMDMMAQRMSMPAAKP